eukprot:gene1822-2046_t
MGIDCKGVHRIIHFGPSKSIEAYLQECGRAGRDNETSSCYMLYNGFLASHCQTDMKQYISSNKCRRVIMENHFPGKHAKCELGCMCCDICMKQCHCTPSCSKALMDFEEPLDIAGEEKNRHVSDDKKKELLEKLNAYKNASRERVLARETVPPQLILEFTDFHVAQVVESCKFLFAIEDVLSHVEIWRMKTGIGILHILHEIFDDVVVNEDLQDLEKNESATDELEGDWIAVRDDSEIAVFDNSYQMQEADYVMEEIDQSGLGNESLSNIVAFSSVKPVLDEDDTEM